MALEKCKKDCNIHLIILVQGFCPMKIKITQFLSGFRLNHFQTTLALRSGTTSYKDCVNLT